MLVVYKFQNRLESVRNVTDTHRPACASAADYRTSVNYERRT